MARGISGLPLRAGANALRALRQGAAVFLLPRGRWWVRVRLASPLPELTAPVLLGREPSLALVEVLQVLDGAARDPRVAGVVLRLEGPVGGLAKAWSLRRAVLALRAAGVPVVVWGEQISTEELLFASAATRVWLPESGSLALVGLRLEAWFLRGLLERVGARAEVVRVGDYKSAAESFTRRGMSPEQREQLEALAGDLFDGLVEAVAESRGLEPDALRKLVDGGPYGARRAAELRLVDDCRYPDQVEEELRHLAPGVGEPDRMPFVDAAAYLSLRAADPGWRPLLRELPRLAYVVAGGTIHRGRGVRGVASDTYRELLERLRRDERVRGVALRIESPGGDAVASDLLWRSLRRLAECKPVVASLGAVAASGGYFLAAGADAIVAEPASLTGSIGVVGGKLDLAGLYERLGIHKEAVERGARAGWLAEERGFSADERKAVQQEMEAVYALFVDRVATGRGLSRERVHAAGRGRVWSGARAHELGLVDAIGGPLEALGLLGKRAGLLPGQAFVLDLHPRIPRIATLRGLLRGWVLGAP